MCRLLPHKYASASKKFIKEYSSKHKCCPICSNLVTYQTYMAYVVDLSNTDSYKDLNKAICSCGWSGVVNDLEPTPYVPDIDFSIPDKPKILTNLKAKWVKDK